MPKIVRLQSGSFEGESKVNEAKTSLDKPVMLVYKGEFESMDGPVTITDEDIQKLADNHNGTLAKLSRLATGEHHPKHNPPLQLDHSTSARDTIGRLVGNLEVGEHTDADGNKIRALMGTARVLGKENVEKVEDGRWVHVSGGFDLENHKVTELTVTPFPAAADASLLSRLATKEGSGNVDGLRFEILHQVPKGYFAVGIGEARNHIAHRYFDKYDEAEHHAELELQGYLDGQEDNLSRLAAYESTYKGVAFKVIPEGGGYSWKIGSSKGGKIFKGENEAVNAAKQTIEAEHLSGDENEDSKKLARLASDNKDEGETMPTYKEMKERMSAFEKCKKHLMGKDEKLSEEAAEEQLAALSDEDVKKMSAEQDEADKKLASEEADKEQAEKAKKDEELKRMGAVKEHKSKLIALSKGVRSTNAKVQLASKKAGISAKLSRFAADRKITPAEMKTIKIDELAGKSDEAINAALSSYEKREPVIDAGLYGTTKAVTPAQLQSGLKKMGMERLELQTRLNMPSKRDAALKRLAEIGEEEKALEVQQDNVAAANASADTDAFFEKLKGLILSGQEIEAKECLQAQMAQGPKEEISPVDQTAEFSSLAEEVKNLHTSFEDVVKLAAPIFGATAEELA